MADAVLAEKAFIEEAEAGEAGESPVFGFRRDTIQAFIAAIRV